MEMVTRHSIAEEADNNESRILLVEDYSANQIIAKYHLENAGYRVDLAEDGGQAVAAFKRRKYDLVFMDIQMPVMDGYQATKTIRELESELSSRENGAAPKTSQRVPIIAMTANAKSENKALCIEGGMDDFQTKPFTRKVLLSMVSKWLDRGAKPAEIRPLAALNPDATFAPDIASMEIRVDKPIDVEKAIEEFQGDRQLLSEVIAAFIMGVGGQMDVIRMALSRGDAETVRKEAHSIKGGAANLTANTLSNAALRLESKGKSNELDGAGEIADILERELEALRRYVHENFQEHVEKSKPGSF